MNDGGGEKEDDSSGGETTSAGEEDETTDGGGGNRTTDVEGGNVTTDGGGGSRTTDVEGGNVTTDGGGDKIKKKMRHPNKLRTGRVTVLTIDEAKFEPATPESVAAGYGNDIGCILRDTVSINETSLRDPSRDHLQVLLIQKLHDRFKFPKPYHDKNDLTTNMVNKKALSKFTQALNSWKGRLRRMIRDGQDYPEVSKKYPQITEEEWTTFKKTASLPEVEDARKWGIGMRGLNIGPHFLGSRG